MLFNLSLPILLSRVVVLIIAFSFHEFAHAWVANRLGDSTPRRDGRLTLNPAVHLDVMGSLMLLFSGFGWARPVRINPVALQFASPRGMLYVSLAGPFSNLLLAALGGIVLRLGLIPYIPPNPVLPTPAQLITEFVIVNIGLMLFNLIPIAPLDGENVLLYFAPRSWAPALEFMSRNGPAILIVLLLLLPYLGLDLVGYVLRPAARALYQFLTGV